MNRFVLAQLLLSIVGMSYTNLAFSQLATPASTAKPVVNQAGNDAATAAERAKIWESPQMLRARAWVKDYCANSVKVTPQEAKEYETELANLTPKQMKLWLLKFQHEEEMIRQQQAMFNNTRQAEVQQAMAAHQQMKQSYANINADANQAAKSTEDSIKQEQEFAQQDGIQKNADRDAAAADLLTRPIFGYGGYGGGVHYHFH